jgi:predicted O-linked N-acetylglucosamine transferase (SPINDLY family)
LKAAGLPELVTRSLAEYEVLALRLAQEPDLLNGFKQRLQAGRHSAPLFDGDRFRASIEDAFRTMQPKK